MILYSKEQKAITTTGVVSTEVRGGGFLYVSTKVFSEALALSGKFKSDVNCLLESTDFRGDHGDLIIEVSELLPEPLNMLTPFFNLIDSEEIPLTKLDLSLAFGLLGMIAKEVNFYKCAMGECPPGLSYSTELLAEYELGCQDIECLFGLVDLDKQQVVESEEFDTCEDVDEEGTVWEGAEDDNPVVNEPVEYVEAIENLVSYYSKYLKKEEKQTVEVTVTEWGTEDETTLLDETDDTVIPFIDREVERLKEEFKKVKEASEDVTMPLEGVI